MDANPYQGKKKGADGGIDGLTFFEDEKGKPKRVIVSVKGGENVTLTMLKDLIATVQGKKAAIGLFVTLSALQDFEWVGERSRPPRWNRITASKRLSLRYPCARYFSI